MSGRPKKVENCLSVLYVLLYLGTSPYNLRITVRDTIMEDTLSGVGRL